MSADLAGKPFSYSAIASTVHTTMASRASAAHGGGPGQRPALRQTPEEGICQAGPALVAAGPLRQGHRLADGSVGRDPVEEPELVGAHPEDLPEPDRQVGHPPPA